GEDSPAQGGAARGLGRTMVLGGPSHLSAGGDGVGAGAARRRKLENFARFPTRPLSVDQLYQSIAQATGHTGVAPPEQPPEPVDDPEEENADHASDLLSERALTVQRALAQLNGGYGPAGTQAAAEAA